MNFGLRLSSTSYVGKDVISLTERCDFDQNTQFIEGDRDKRRYEPKAEPFCELTAIRKLSRNVMGSLGFD